MAFLLINVQLIAVSKSDIKAINLGKIDESVFLEKPRSKKTTLIAN